MENKGIYGRVTGDMFANGNNKLEFLEIESYPQDGYDRYDTPEERDTAIATLEQQLNQKIIFTNNPTAGALSFAVAALTDPDNKNKPVYWGRYFRFITVNMFGKWPNNGVPSGWKLQMRGSKKLDLGLDPQHLIKTEKKFSGSESVIAQVQANSSGHVIQSDLVNGLKFLAKGANPTFKDQIENLPALRDYFGEIMGPVALMSGKVKGDADMARNDLMGGVNWKDAKVFWPMSANYNLVDSIFVGPNGEEIGISSKGGKGARASAKNISDAIEKSDPKLQRKYKITVEVMRIIAENTAIDGPFRLAERYGILPLKLEAEIKKYIASGKTDYSRISKGARELFNYGTPRTDIPGFNTGFALLGLLAKKVATAVNADAKFGQGCLAFLNQSSIVQLYCKMGKSGTDAVVTSWDAVYPPNFSGTVVLDGAKNYYSSRAGGKFAFGFV